MTFIQQKTITVSATSTGGGSNAFGNLTGEIVGLMFSSTSMSTGVDITATTLGSSQTIWAESNVTSPATRVPRQPTHSSTGGQLIFSTTGGTLGAVAAPFFIQAEKINIAVEQAGTDAGGTNGAFTVLLR